MTNAARFREDGGLALLPGKIRRAMTRRLMRSLLFGGFAFAVDAASAWRRDVYVWPTAPSEKLRSAPTGSGDAVDGFCPLAA